MVKYNGTALEETLNGPGGYLQVNAALLNAACDNFFDRRGIPRHDFFGHIRPVPPATAKIARVAKANKTTARKFLHGSFKSLLDNEDVAPVL